ncbi:hypothetical protein D9M68_686920 [compost metagenome]
MKDAVKGIYFRVFKRIRVYLCTIFKVGQELLIYFFAESLILYHYITFGMMKGGPIGNIERTYGHKIIINDEVFGVEGTGLLPFINLNAMLEQVFIMLSTLPVHPAHKSVDHQRPGRFFRISDQLDCYTPVYSVFKIFRENARWPYAVAAPVNPFLCSLNFFQQVIGQFQFIFIIRFVRHVGYRNVALFRVQQGYGIKTFRVLMSS